jgi:hypothetical protein
MLPGIENAKSPKNSPDGKLSHNSPGKQARIYTQFPGDEGAISHGNETRETEIQIQPGNVLYHG